MDNCEFRINKTVTARPVIRTSTPEPAKHIVNANSTIINLRPWHKS